MSANSKIEWTEASWNPVTGCDKISDGCRNCYAERMSHRLKAIGSPNYCNGFKLTLHPESLTLPLKWKKPRMIFVNSMSDLFHKDVPLQFIINVFKVMNLARNHTFQVLTKRSDRLFELSPHLPWSNNIWMGVTIEKNDYLFRLEHLKKTDSAVKFLSLEPLLGPIKETDFTGIDWVIAGGESGPGSRPINPQWIRDIRNYCINENIPFFFKQWGGFNKKKNGRVLDGRIWDEMPHGSFSELIPEFRMV